MKSPERPAGAIRPPSLATFMRQLGHELGNPLSSIRLSAEMLQSELPEDVRQELLQIVLAESQRLESIVERAVCFALLVKPRLHPVVLQELVESALDQFAGTISVFLDFPSGADQMIALDPQQMIRLVRELVANALEAGASTLRIDQRSLPGAVMLRFVDNGSGVAVKDIRRLFEPFVSTRDGSTGLGLSICRRIVGSHGGAIRLLPEDSGGMTVEVTLPFTE